MYRNLCQNIAELFLPTKCKWPKEFRKGCYARLPYTNQKNLFSGYNLCFWKEKKGLKVYLQLLSQESTPHKWKHICAHKDLYVNIQGSIVHHSQKWKQPKCLPAGENKWYMEYYSAIKKSELQYVCISKYHNRRQMQKTAYTWLH